MNCSWEITPAALCGLAVGYHLSWVTNVLSFLLLINFSPGFTHRS